MSALKDVLERAQHWPEGAQDKLVRAALVIEQDQDSDFEFSDKDWKIIDERIAGTARGDIATDDEVKAVFNKFRLT